MVTHTPQKSTQPYDTVRSSRREIMINNFLGGISWALGTTVGLTLILAIFGVVLKNISLVPIVGKFILQINDFIAINSQFVAH